MTYTAHIFQPSREGYEAIAALQQVVAPHRRPLTAEELQQDDADWPEDILNQQFVALDQDNHMVAFGVCYEAYWQHQPGTVHLHFDIHPAHPQAQILAVLYETCRNWLKHDVLGRQVQVLTSRAREDNTERVQFLLSRGFRPAMRSPSAALHVAGFNAADFQAYSRRVAHAKIRISTLAHLYTQDPDWKQKLCELRWALLQDVPSPQPPTRPTLAEFEQMILEDPALEPQAFFVAATRTGANRTGAFIGMSNLWRNDPTGKRLDAGLTGTVRAYRRQGIATALKVLTIQYAQASGAETIVTNNEENNPMYDLNCKLGFRTLPAWVNYRKIETSNCNGE